MMSRKQVEEILQEAETRLKSNRSQYGMSFDAALLTTVAEMARDWLEWHDTVERRNKEAHEQNKRIDSLNEKLQEREALLRDLDEWIAALVKEKVARTQEEEAGAQERRIAELTRRLNDLEFRYQPLDAAKRAQDARFYNPIRIDPNVAHPSIDAGQKYNALYTHLQQAGRLARDPALRDFVRERDALREQALEMARNTLHALAELAERDEAPETVVPDPTPDPFHDEPEDDLQELSGGLQFVALASHLREARGHLMNEDTRGLLLGRPDALEALESYVEAILQEVRNLIDEWNVDQAEEAPGDEDAPYVTDAEEEERIFAPGTLGDVFAREERDKKRKELAVAIRASEMFTFLDRATVLAGEREVQAYYEGNPTLVLEYISRLRHLERRLFNHVRMGISGLQVKAADLEKQLYIHDADAAERAEERRWDR